MDVARIFIYFFFGGGGRGDLSQHDQQAAWGPKGRKRGWGFGQKATSILPISYGVGERRISSSAGTASRVSSGSRCCRQSPCRGISHRWTTTAD